ncbi:hypothetical protein A3J34_02015, partial [Candidatus Peribacteria bacterium RIFCSPLOWO2_02_FULL_51_10]
MDLYAENILDHYRHPRNAGELKKFSVRHKEENLSCGDELSFDLKIKNGKISSLAWTGTGCAISQAAMSILSEELEGISVDSAEKFDSKKIMELLKVPVGPRRTKCALLCLHALKNALHEFKKEPTQSWTET